MLRPTITGNILSDYFSLTWISDAKNKYRPLWDQKSSLFLGSKIIEARNQRIWWFPSPEITALPTSQNWDYFGYYLVPSITCHHCLLCTWYDTCLLYTPPIIHNKESQTHLRQHTALVVCETKLRPHTNATAAAPPSKPRQRTTAAETAAEASMTERHRRQRTCQVIKNKGKQHT